MTNSIDGPQEHTDDKRRAEQEAEIERFYESLAPGQRVAFRDTAAGQTARLAMTAQKPHLQPPTTTHSSIDQRPLPQDRDQLAAWLGLDPATATHDQIEAARTAYSAALPKPDFLSTPAVTTDADGIVEQIVGDEPKS